MSISGRSEQLRCFLLRDASEVLYLVDILRVCGCKRLQLVIDCPLVDRERSAIGMMNYCYFIEVEQTIQGQDVRHVDAHVATGIPDGQKVILSRLDIEELLRNATSVGAGDDQDLRLRKVKLWEFREQRYRLVGARILFVPR
jgi:hypothetical protein